MLTNNSPMLGSHGTGLATRFEDTEERESMNNAGRHTKARRDIKVRSRRALRRVENAEWRDELIEDFTFDPQIEHDIADENWQAEVISDYWWADIEIHPFMKLDVSTSEDWKYLSDLDDFYYMDGTHR